MNLEIKYQQKIRLKIQAKLKLLKAVKDGEDLEAIKKATEELTQEFYAVSIKDYAEAEASTRSRRIRSKQHEVEQMQGAQHDDNVVDADFKVKEDK